MADRDLLPHLTLGTAGHIDHGKTALVGALTGKNTDRLAEEHRRGISIELGFAELDLGDRTMSVVDVPGHERLVRTMVAGASGIDLFLLVVAADDGPMPQTAEHLTVLHALGVDRGAIALTKRDLVDDAQLARAHGLARDLVPGAPVVAVSAVTGEGLGELRSKLDAVAAELDGRGPREDLSRPAVMHVDRAFSLRGIGTVVTGTLRQGTLRVGDRVVLQPSGREARIRSLQSHDRARDVVHAGRRVAINLAGIDRDEVERGDVVAAAESAIRPSYRLDVELGGELVARQLDGRRVQVHHGTRDAPARVVPIAEGWVQLRLERPLMALAGDPVVLREIAPATTLGGATVIDPIPPRHGASGEARLRRIIAGEPAEPVRAEPAPAPPPPRAASPGPLAQRVLGLLRDDGLRPRSLSRLAEDLAQAPAEVVAAVDELTAAGLALRAGRDLAFAAEAVTRAEATVIELGSETEGFSLADARDRLGIGRKHTQALLELLDARRVTLRRGDRRVLRQTRENP